MKREQKVMDMNRNIIFILKKSGRLVIKKSMKSGMRVNIFWKVQKEKLVLVMMVSIILERMDFIILWKVRFIRRYRIIKGSIQRVEWKERFWMWVRVLFILRLRGSINISILKKVESGSSMMRLLYIRLKKVGIRVKQKGNGWRSIKKVIKELRQNGVLSIFKVMSLKLVNKVMLLRVLNRVMLLRVLRCCRKRNIVQLKGMINSRYQRNIIWRLFFFKERVIMLSMVFNFSSSGSSSRRRRRQNLFIVKSFWY